MDPNRPQRERDFCSTCGHHIGAGEDDVILLHRYAPLMVRFHHLCAKTAYQLVEMDARQWDLIHRKAEPNELN